VERHAGTSRVGDTRLEPAYHPKRYAPQTSGLHELGFQPKSPDFDLQRHNLARQFSSPPAAQRSELQPDFLEAMREQAASKSQKRPCGQYQPRVPPSLPKTIILKCDSCPPCLSTTTCDPASAFASIMLPLANRKMPPELDTT
jgi:hypothetical protein